LTASHELPPTRVVIADDDDSFAALVAAVLACDRRVTVVGRARDGVEAVELTRNLQPDVVLMDINMPVLDGVGATREIVKLPEAPAVVVVSATDYTDRALEARFAGAVDFVRKGRLDSDLLDAIAGAMRRRNRETRTGH
jgi:chemotaxis response regulator CheB